MEPAKRSTTPHGGRTRGRLVAATTELLQEGGYAAASVAAIAGRAGVATGTLYRHFPSKAELFVEVFREVCSREIVAVTKGAVGRRTAGERIDAIVEVFATRALRNPRLAWALVAEPVDPLVDAERLAFRRTYRDHIALVLADGVRRGEFREQDVQLTAAAMVGAIGDALIGPLSPVNGESSDPAVVVPELQAFCRNAIATRSEPA
jgi:AcrR family transcriptional regulator